MSRLLVALPLPGAAGAELGFTVQSENGKLTHHGHAVPAALPRLGAVMVVVPAQALSWHRIELPKAPAARLRAALEGVLEDKLLDEPAQLHFALQSDAKPGSSAWVAVCDKAWLRSQLMRLVEVGLPITRVLPEATPRTLDQAPQLHVSGSDHQPQAVWADTQGVQQGSLALLLDAGLDLNGAQISGEPQVLERAEHMLQQAPALQTAAERLAAALQSDWNLAQFDLRKLGATGWWPTLASGLRALALEPVWRPLRWAVGLGLVLNLVGLNATAWSQSRALQAKRAALKDTLTQTFPQVKVVIDAQRQMQREVQVLRQATGAATERDADVMLTALAAAAPDLKAPSGMDYANGELTLKAVGLAAEQLEPINQRLQANGLQARVEGANLLVKAQVAP
jgi:general secretion pathway protein L